MKKVLLVTLISLMFTGCATNEYEMYADSHARIEIAKANADAERFKAMSAIAQNGDSSAKIAAVVAMAMSGGASGNGGKQDNMTAPQPNQALQWASILVPGVTQLYGISANMRVAMNQSDNATKVAVSTNDTFVGISSKIQAPVVVAPQPNITLSGTGTIGGGSYSTSANQANQTLAGSGVLGSGTYSPQANQTLAGTGTLGSGAYTTNDNHTVTPTPVVTVTPVTPITPVVQVAPVVVTPATVVCTVTATTPTCK